MSDFPLGDRWKGYGDNEIQEIAEFFGNEEQFNDQNFPAEVDQNEFV